MKLDSVLITGANTGIGLEFVRQLVLGPRPPRYVFATYKLPGSLLALENIKNSSKDCNVMLISMDVTVSEEVVACRRAVESTLGDDVGLTLLVSNAGFCETGGEGFDVDAHSLHTHLAVNAVGPACLLKEMLPLLRRSSESRKDRAIGFSRSAVLNIASRAGSLSSVDRTQKVLREGQSMTAYHISKAALNMAMQVASLYARKDGILVVLIHPGYVHTDMTAGNDNPRKISVQESVSAMLRTCSSLDQSHQGAFIDRNGQTIPF